MSKNFSIHNRRIVFYFLIGYLVILFMWWWLMMFRKDNELHREKIQQLYYTYEENESAEYLKAYDAVLNDRERQRWMLVGEGATFLILMILGVFKLSSNIKEEVGTAGRQRNYFLSITHELKSPLASAKLSLQTLRKRKLNEEQQAHLLQNAEDDINRLSDLVDKILLASKMEDESTIIQIEEVNFSEIVEDCKSNILIRNIDTEIKEKIEEGVWVNGDELMLKSLVLNLLENAIKYAPRNTPIVLNLRKSQEMAVLEVADDGMIIPEDEKEKIFERFYRVGNDETRTTTGVGLGLFIVGQVTRLHHGNVKIIDNNTKGKTFRIEIPYIGAI
ncbi:MAG: HAMP domain-containing histidine kinase [Chitinophagales bacterium]|nr:HAMP domain-containing histidine kinase [Chitinophagales bacterium]